MDRAAQPLTNSETDQVSGRSQFHAAVEQAIIDWCASILEAEVNSNQRLFLASLEAVDLNARFELDLGVSLPLESLLSGPRVSELAMAVIEAGAEDRGNAQPLDASLNPAPTERFEPFPLTEIQQAYLIGRETALELGGVSTHLYSELEARDVDLPRLQLALRRVIERHDMLRAIITTDCRQQVLADVPPYEIALTDLSAADEETTSSHLARVRAEMSHQLLPADRWPLFEVRASGLAGGITRIHFSLDLLIADGQSIAILLDEWRTLYRDPTTDLAPLQATFRDYVLAANELKKGPAYERARSYWLGRIENLPAAPDLPSARSAATSDGRRVRRSMAFDSSTWDQLKQRAPDAELTPSNLLCAAYAEILSTWSRDPRFTLNVTLGTRLPLHRDVRRMIGDFTSSVLLEVDNCDEAPFQDRARAIQRTLQSDLEHRIMGGVEVQREVAKTRGGSFAAMPIVFTSLIGVDVPKGDPATGFPDLEIYGISQTPQVSLDQVVVERDGELHITWDAVEDIFPAQMLDAMFDAYCGILKRIARDPRVLRAAHPVRLPADQLEQRATINQTNAAVDERLLLHTLVDERCETLGQATAVVCEGDVLSFAELDRRANQLAHRLMKLGVARGSLVPIVMRKGWEQVVGALAVLRTGAAYVPVDSCTPTRRLHGLLRQVDASVALTQAAVDGQTDWPAALERISVDSDSSLEGGDAVPVRCSAQPDDLAYVIFTSGSTGTPKGVMIEHRTAVNTIVDCIERFELDHRDRVLALSALSFDLSVFDVFATLAVGGTVVMPGPSETRDPVRWAELVQEHGVTVWNSVPALFDMFVEYASSGRAAAGQSLRLAMLSGDWIPVDLPDRARSIKPTLQVVGLGGATEGSIWSISYPIEVVDPGWTSIPYGRPMANQQMYVLDQHLLQQPVWVPGDLFIGGSGVARGYLGDEQKTGERFIAHPDSGERLYRTGDLGRYLPDGEIEFLGRADFQVKVRGHRIEPGEIEAALREHPSVRSALVVALGEKTGPKRLIAYLVGNVSEHVSDGDLRDFLKFLLPDYMIPAAFVPVSDWPLTANGKVDLQRLPEPSWNSSVEPGEGHNGSANGASKLRADQPHVDLQTEEIFSELFAEILHVETLGPHDSFFEHGGDSLLALRLIAKAGAAGLRIDPETFFEHPTIAEISLLATREHRELAEQTALSGSTDLTPSQLWFFEQGFEDFDHWNGMWPLLSVTERLDPVLLGSALHKVLCHHDMLRARFNRTDDGWQAAIVPPDELGSVPFSTFDFSDLTGSELEAAVEAASARCQSSLSLSEGPSVRLSYFDLGAGRPGRLHVAAHWVTLDYYSSRIFFEDLQSAYLQLRHGTDPVLPAKTTPFPHFARLLIERSADPEVIAELAEWISDERKAIAPLPGDQQLGPNRQSSARRVLISLGQEQTRALVGPASREYGCEVRELILAALARAVTSWGDQPSVLVEIEGHGRDQMIAGVDMSRTIGRTSTLWPALLDVESDDDPSQAVARVVSRMRSHPNRGMGHGVLRYLSDDAQTRQLLAEMPSPELGLNYWGQVEEYFTDLIRPSAESPGDHRSDAGQRPRVFDVLGFLAADELTLVWTYSENLHQASTVQALAESTISELQWLLAPYSEDHELPVATLIDESRPMESDGRWRLPADAGAAEEHSGVGV